MKHCVFVSLKWAFYIYLQSYSTYSLFRSPPCFFTSPEQMTKHCLHCREEWNQHCSVVAATPLHVTKSRSWPLKQSRYIIRHLWNDVDWNIVTPGTVYVWVSIVSRAYLKYFLAGIITTVASKWVAVPLTLQLCKVKHIITVTSAL